MFYVIKFRGEARKNIAKSASEYYEGLLHQVLVEYLPAADVTLLYCFNMEMKEIKQLFSLGDWFWQNAVIPDWVKDPLRAPHQQSYYYIENDLQQLTEGQDKNFSLVNYQTARGISVFKNLNSILEFRDITKTWTVNGESRTRRIKRFGIRIEENNWSGPEEFDSIDQLKELLITKYKGKRLVPISYTPWDSKEWHEEAARQVEDLTLLYLFEYHTFEIRKY